MILALASRAWCRAARGIQQSFPELDVAQIPMAARVRQEKVVYLLDPIGASRRSRPLRMVDKLISGLGFALPLEHEAIELPYTPEFLNKHDGLLLSLGQFNLWVGSQMHGLRAACRYGRACPSRRR